MTYTGRSLKWVGREKHESIITWKRKFGFLASAHARKEVFHFATAELEGMLVDRFLGGIGEYCGWVSAYLRTCVRKKAPFVFSMTCW